MTVMVVSVVESRISISVSVSVRYTRYRLITPFFCSDGGGPHVREMLVELMTVPVRF